jgi:iron complex transport system permease protein
MRNAPRPIDSGAREAPGAGIGRLAAIAWRIAALLALSCAALFASLCLGSVAIAPGDVADALLRAIRMEPHADSAIAAIVLELRLARTLLALLSGAALGVSGAILQGLFRNPLADPYSLGVSSGASLGATVAILSGAAFPGGVEGSAFTGAIAAAALVFLVAGTSRTGGPAPLLLAGAAVSAFVAAAVALAVALNDRDLHRVYFWLLGGFGGKGWADLAAAAPMGGLAVAASLALARPLDLFGAGEESARSMGLDVRAARLAAVGVASLAAAVAVSSGGIIGFVGLAGPHIARPLVGPAHSRLLPASALAGASMLAVSDALARTLAAPLELPVGVITAILGAPLFLRLIAKKGGRP